MNRNAAIIAALVGLLGAGLLYGYIRKFEERTSGGQPIQLLMATQDIALGTLLTKEMVGMRTLPETYVEDRHVRVSDLSRIIGVRVSSTIKANESVLWTDLAGGNTQRRNLSDLVQPGQRAFSIAVDSGASFAGLLRPGDRVDVFASASSSPAPILQNVLVLAIGQDTGAASDSSRRTGSTRGSQVSLSATHEQAQVLARAQARGKLLLTLRNPDDISIIESATPSALETNTTSGGFSSLSATKEIENVR